ncbi:hypothetical protein EB06_02200 [Enterococcus cecorum]|uniref:helix-turn-helix domain-containing protein n=1 Tax=Enterococcus cecorum TaxID=44008 RepID=UPI000DEBAB29|nr:helix-turn-helix transcriptional regulator [Enterococcus cecorum]RBR27237.1 hypothetical protein EB06_02200 [Enterococcus cecorum]
MKIHLGKLLNEKGLTISELHQLTGIARTTLTPLSKEEILPSKTRFDTLDKICNALNIDESELLSFEDEWEISLLDAIKRDQGTGIDINVYGYAEKYFLVFIAKRNDIERYFAINILLEYDFTEEIEYEIDKECERQGLSILKIDYEKWDKAIQRVMTDKKVPIATIYANFISYSNLRLKNLFELYRANRFENNIEQYKDVLPLKNIDATFISNNIHKIINEILVIEKFTAKRFQDKVDVIAEVSADNYATKLYWNYFSKEKTLKEDNKYFLPRV